jgi:hypothetical protein
MLTECGHKNAMFSGRTIYVIAPLHLTCPHALRLELRHQED